MVGSAGGALVGGRSGPDSDRGLGRRLLVCALDDALESLTRIDPRRAKVIELRFFGGLSVEETADVLQVSPQTVMRDWRLARAWLARGWVAMSRHPIDVYGLLAAVRQSPRGKTEVRIEQLAFGNCHRAEAIRRAVAEERLEDRI